MSVGPERSSGVVKPTPPPFAEEPTRPLSVAGAGDHCVNCGAPLASDQRYCVTCGERRGKPRFTLAAPADATVQDTTVRAASLPRRPRTSAGFNLIAGVATLLLAMGVGVLIGHSNSSANAGHATSTPAITINGGGAASTNPASAAGAGSTGARSTRGSHTAKGRHGGSAKAAKAPPKVVIQKAAAAASKVTGGSAKVAPANSTQGSSCGAGTAGCQNGKLTGNFFGQ
ncbi:MAG TPA: hypothetical protein VGH67_03150 [Solirubrobacteraceae bacterium]|jgi:hypothetical protein